MYSSATYKHITLERYCARVSASGRMEIHFLWVYYARLCTACRGQRGMERLVRGMPSAVYANAKYRGNSAMTVEHTTGAKGELCHYGTVAIIYVFTSLK